MPKLTTEKRDARQEEIITACAALYQTMSFQEITIKEISKATSFTRTAIYHYFHTKEEIFLSLLKQEYTLWIHRLRQMQEEATPKNPQNFAPALARSLAERETLLKLMSMNHYDLEENCRMEHLVAFKKVYGQAITEMRRCLSCFFPKMDAEEIQSFIYSFFPFLFGIYPYTAVSPKQREAMARAGVDYRYLSIYELALFEIQKLLHLSE